MKPKITLIQMIVEPGKKEKNLNRALKLIEENKDSDFICLPEEFLCSFDYSKSDIETIPGKVTDEFCKKAKLHNLIIISSFVEKYKNNYYVSAPVIGRKGILGIYRKMHIYRSDLPIKTMTGKKYLTCGKKIKMFNSRFGKFGVAICKDLYYPEIFRALKLKGAKFVFIPCEDWAPIFFEHMACSRALENELYICLVNSWIINKHMGRSLIAGPYVEIIKAEDGEAILKKIIDLKHNLVGKEKIFSDIKFELYGLERYYKSKT